MRSRPPAKGYPKGSGCLSQAGFSLLGEFQGDPEGKEPVAAGLVPWLKDDSVPKTRTARFSCRPQMSREGSASQVLHARCHFKDLGNRGAPSMLPRLNSQPRGCRSMVSTYSWSRAVSALRNAIPHALRRSIRMGDRTAGESGTLPQEVSADRGTPFSRGGRQREGECPGNGVSRIAEFGVESRGAAAQAWLGYSGTYIWERMKARRSFGRRRVASFRA